MLTSRRYDIAAGFVMLWFTLEVTPLVVAKHLNMLMIGNSYTQGNATARATSLDLQGLFDADADFSAEISVRADSSASLQQHANNFQTTSLITSGANVWDVIVLQERSDRPALAMKYGGSERTGLDSGGPALIGNYIEPFQPQASVVLFDTWARMLDNQDLIDDFDNNPMEMLAFTNQGYDRIRENGSHWDYSDVTSIARVGDAWNAWYETYGYSDYVLHGSDGTHQNDRGAYLAAAILFETITGKTTVGNGYAGAVTGSIGGVSQLLLLQLQATGITGAVAGIPGDYNQDGRVDAADYTRWRDQLGDANPLPNDNTIGVGQDDYSRWIEHFGDMSDGQIPFASDVPETTTLATALVALGVALGCGLVERMRRHSS
jgi:hypothetical protein